MYGMHVNSHMCLPDGLLHMFLRLLMCPTGASHTPLHSLQSTLSQDVIAQLLPMPAESQNVLCRHTIDCVHAQSLTVPIEQVSSSQHILSQSHYYSWSTVKLVTIGCNPYTGQQ